MSAPPRPTGALRYCGRNFNPADLELIRTLVAILPTRAAIAEAICEALDRRRPDGAAKAMSARVACLRMAADGLVVLPPPRNTNGNGRIPRRERPASEPIHTTLAALEPLRLSVVTTPAESAHYNELIATHLGWDTPTRQARLHLVVGNA